MNIIKKIIISTFILLLIVCGKTVLADAVEKKSFTMILIPDFSFQEVKWLKENGHFLELWKSGGLSAVNIRPDGPYSYLNNMVTMASGARGLGVEGWNAFIKGETENGVLVEELYQQWTGTVVDEGIIFHPLLHKLVDKNKDTSYRSEIGILGQTLKEHGISSYVIGNSDAGTEKVRYGSLLTMDKEGVAKGSLQEATKKSVESPWGSVMDVGYIFETLNTIQTSLDPAFTVVEWGDIHRLYKQKGNMTQTHFTKQYELTLVRLEQFLNELLTNGYAQNVMLLSPMVNTDAYQNKERLAPLFYWQTSAFNDRYYLYSGTTRQKYVVSNLDIVPTVLDFLRLMLLLPFLGVLYDQKWITTSRLKLD
ncbi:hypothetical protein H1D32_01765 [Anaerobacillus sp. CMMVII]|uniref:hypothetical protein n=1 Tax=Anaerobacillus sp. CMMVII TaxID=2755588 RepID=UPI0021B74705|nr:hypothetical protein [Anaerobacillus sp. CMMVII]MCT8136588.1 hypothetical protein [Anaerobacillus sp. CMMVII]